MTIWLFDKKSLIAARKPNQETVQENVKFPAAEILSATVLQVIRRRGCEDSRSPFTIRVAALISL